MRRCDSRSEDAWLPNAAPLARQDHGGQPLQTAGDIRESVLLQYRHRQLQERDEIERVVMQHAADQPGVTRAYEVVIGGWYLASGNIVAAVSPTDRAVPVSAVCSRASLFFHRRRA